MTTERQGADWDRLRVLYAGYLRGDGEATERLFTDLLRSVGGYFATRVRDEAIAHDLAQSHAPENPLFP